MPLLNDNALAPRQILVPALRADLLPHSVDYLDNMVSATNDENQTRYINVLYRRGRREKDLLSP
jgi:hypothetical protein